MGDGTGREESPEREPGGAAGGDYNPDMILTSAEGPCAPGAPL